MISFSEILDRAAARKGGAAALESLLSETIVKSPDDLAALGDDRWLSMMTKCIFQAGFNWKVIENKWAGFEEAFDGFEIGRWALAPDEDLDRLASDTRIVRNGMKIATVPVNAVLLSNLASEAGSAARYIADWPAEQQIELLDRFKKEGSRIGGNTGQYFLRFMGKESFILSQSVNNALIHDRIIDKPATSKKALRSVQEAFNSWKQESGRSMTHISRVVAMSID